MRCPNVALFLCIFAGPPGGQFSVAMTFRVSGDEEKAHGNYLALVVGSPEAIRRRGKSYQYIAVRVFFFCLTKNILQRRHVRFYREIFCFGGGGEDRSLSSLRTVVAVYNNTFFYRVV